MSRWLESFENHPFQNIWNEILTATKDLQADDETIVTDVEELARFKKVVKYLDKLINACDPELVPESTWKNSHTQSNSCLQQLKAYLSNRNNTHIKTANGHLDNLLTYIRPYQVESSESAKSSSVAFKAYTQTIESSLSSFQSKARSLLSDIRKISEKVSNEADESEKASNKIKTLALSYFDDTESESLSTRIAKYEKNIKTIDDELSQFRREFYEGDGEKKSAYAQIEEALEIANSESKYIKKLLNEVDSKVIDFDVYYLKIFGEKTKEGKLEGGLKSEIDLRSKNLDEFKEQQETQYKALNDEIEGLLAGATTVGLASAYSTLKDSFNSPILTYSKLFYASIFTLFVVSFISITDKVYWFGIEFVDISDYKNLFSNLVFKLSIIVPILWLAIFASKRRSEASRLQQEYSHKEALAKSYLSFKKQIEELNQPSEKLMEKLLGSAIDAVSKNASETLDKKHGDKTPVHQIIDGVMDAMDKSKVDLTK